MTHKSRLAGVQASIHHHHSCIKSILINAFCINFTLLSLIATQLCPNVSANHVVSNSLYDVCNKSSYHCMGLSEPEDELPTRDCVQSKNCLLLLQTQLMPATQKNLPFNLRDQKRMAKHCFYYNESKSDLFTTTSTTSTSTSGYVLVGVRMVLNKSKPLMDILCGFQKRDRPQQSQIVYFYSDKNSTVVDRERFVPGVQPVHTYGGRWILDKEANIGHEESKEEPISNVNTLSEQPEQPYQRKKMQTVVTNSRLRYCCFEQPFQLIVQHSNQEWSLELDPQNLQAHLFYRKNGHKLTSRDERPFSLEDEKKEEEEEEAKKTKDNDDDDDDDDDSEKSINHVSSTTTIESTDDDEGAVDHHRNEDDDDGSKKLSTNKFFDKDQATTTTSTIPHLTWIEENFTTTVSTINMTIASPTIGTQSATTFARQPEATTAGNWDSRKTMALLFISFVLMCFLLIIAVTLYNLFIKS